MRQKVTGYIKGGIVSGPTLERLEPYQIFYIKKYWFKGSMGEEILQDEDPGEARKSQE